MFHLKGYAFLCMLICAQNVSASNNKSPVANILKDPEAISYFFRVFMNEFKTFENHNECDIEDIINDMESMITSFRNKKSSKGKALEMAFATAIAEVTIGEAEKNINLDLNFKINAMTTALQTAFKMTYGEIDNKFINKVVEIVQKLHDEQVEEQETAKNNIENNITREQNDNKQNMISSEKNTKNIKYDSEIELQNIKSTEIVTQNDISQVVTTGIDGKQIINSENTHEATNMENLFNEVAIDSDKRKNEIKDQQVITENIITTNEHLNSNSKYTSSKQSDISKFTEQDSTNILSMQENTKTFEAPIIEPIEDIRPNKVVLHHITIPATSNKYIETNKYENKAVEKAAAASSSTVFTSKSGVSQATLHKPAPRPLPHPRPLSLPKPVFVPAPVPRPRPVVTNSYQVAQARTAAAAATASSVSSSQSSVSQATSHSSTTSAAISSSQQVISVSRSLFSESLYSSFMQLSGFTETFGIRFRRSDSESYAKAISMAVISSMHMNKEHSSTISETVTRACSQVREGSSSEAYAVAIAHSLSEYLINTGSIEAGSEKSCARSIAMAMSSVITPPRPKPLPIPRPVPKRVFVPAPAPRPRPVVTDSYQVAQARTATAAAARASSVSSSQSSVSQATSHSSATSTANASTQNVIKRVSMSSQNDFVNLDNHSKSISNVAGSSAITSSENQLSNDIVSDSDLSSSSTDSLSTSSSSDVQSHVAVSFENNIDLSTNSEHFLSTSALRDASDNLASSKILLSPSKLRSPSSISRVSTLHSSTLSCIKSDGSFNYGFFTDNLKNVAADIKSQYPEMSDLEMVGELFVESVLAFTKALGVKSQAATSENFAAMFSASLSSVLS